MVENINIIDPNAPREIPIVKPIGTNLGDYRKFNAIQLCITTKCNRNCKSCIFKMPYVEGEHVDVDWIKYISKHFQGLRLVQVSGGEPTTHPDFQYITENIRQWFKPQMLMLVTNGHKIIQYADILGHYDHIRITYYNKDTYSGSSDNMSIIKRFKNKFKGSSRIYAKLSKHRVDINKEKILPCGLGANDLALVFNKKLYPCCSASGIDINSCIEITENWKEELKKVKLPCDKGCPFASTREIFDAWVGGLARSNPEEFARLVGKFEDGETKAHNKIKSEGWGEWTESWLD